MTFYEYIQTDGYCYFDTGIIPDINTEVRAIITPITDPDSSAMWNVFFGSQSRDDSRDSFQLRRYETRNRWAPRVGATANQRDNPYEIGTTYNIVLNKTALTANGVNYGLNTTSFNTSQYTMYIGAVHNPNWIPNGDSTGGNRPGRGIPAQFGEFRVYKNNILVADLVPASDGALLGFYDNVAGTFRQNLGTGTPVMGPSLSSINISPASKIFPYSGDSLTIAVTCENSWTAAADDGTWVTLSTNAGTGDGNVTITIPSYTGNVTREDTVTFTDTSTGDIATFSVKQKKYSDGQPVYLGNIEISEMYLGTIPITEAYLGDINVFVG